MILIPEHTVRKGESKRMKTISLDLPDDLAERLQQQAASQGMDLNHYAIARLQEAIPDMGDDPHLMELLARCTDEAETGPLLTTEEVTAAVRARMERFKQENPAT